MSGIDRRGRFRERGWFAVRLEGAQGGGTTVARNVCEGGLLLVSRKRLAVGESVSLCLHVDPKKEPPWVLEGTVVRAQPNAADPGGLWPYALAIAFVEPVPELLHAVRAAA